MHQEIQPGIFANSECGGRGAEAGFGDVPRQQQGAASLGTDGVARFLGGGLRVGVEEEGEVGPFAREEDGNRATQRGVGGRDQGDQSLELVGSRVQRRLVARGRGGSFHWRRVGGSTRERGSRFWRHGARPGAR